MILDIKIGNQRMKPPSVDLGIIDPITKKSNSQRDYSQLAQNIFHDLNVLTNSPKYQSSGKCNCN